MFQTGAHGEQSESARRYERLAIQKHFGFQFQNLEFQNAYQQSYSDKPVYALLMQSGSLGSKADAVIRVRLALSYTLTV